MGRSNKPWFRKDIGWWVTNIGPKQVRLAKGKSKSDQAAEQEAKRAFHELMALRPKCPDAHDTRVCDLAEAFLDFARRKKYSDDTYRNYLFEIIMRRHEVCSTIMTSNRPIEDWGKLLGDVPSATAILDRFLQDAEIITITGKSYRLRGRGAKKPRAVSE